MYLGQVDLRVRPGDVGDLLALPSIPNTFLAEDEHETLWLGPDEWLLVTASETTRPLIDRLADDLRGTHHSIVDVSANRAAIDLGGEGRLHVLAHGCSIDLHPRVWSRPMCAQTVLAGVPVIIQERDAGTRVFVRPSYLPHITAWLDRVMR
jgi:sarcosine oxidase subunit gamma